MINLSLEQLKIIANIRNVKKYKSKSEDELINILSESEPKISLSKKRIKEIREKFDLSNEDYYQPIIINDAFNSNYIEHESKGDKDNTLSIKKYFDIVRRYLSDIINNHKTQGECKVHSSNTIIDYKPHGEWKI